MPKPVVITKQMIDDAAIAVVKESGFAILTARNIALRLNCSTQPIYKSYENMDELKESTIATLANYMMKSIVKYRKTGCAYLDSGLGYINFARMEKVLFQLFCFANENHSLLKSDMGNEVIRKLMEQELFGLTLSKVKKDKIFLQTMVFTHGLAVLAFGGQLEMGENETAELLQETFEGFVNQEMGEKNHEYSCSWGKS